MMRVTPFGEMDRLFDEMRRSMMHGTRNADIGSSTLHLEDDDDEFVVYVDLPGFETDEIDLRFEDETLRIEALHEFESDSESEESDDEVTMRDVRRRHVRRQVRIPGNVLVEDIEAEYNNGVLEVRLPKATDEETGHRIDID